MGQLQGVFRNYYKNSKLNLHAQLMSTLVRIRRSALAIAIAIDHELAIVIEGRELAIDLEEFKYRIK